MFEKFEYWCMGIRPDWVGFIVFISTIILFSAIFLVAFLFLVSATNGWFLLAIPAFILYAWYIALFKQ